MKDLVSNDDTEVVSVKSKISKGQEFKQKYGISKTFKRNMMKYGFLSIGEIPTKEKIEYYRDFRKGRKKKAKADARKITPHKAASAEIKPKKKK